MKSLTLGVLLCDSVDPSRLHIAGDYPDLFRALFAEATPPGFHVSLRFYDVTTGHYPDDLAECDGYLTNGAAASVNDPDPWIADLAAFLRHLHAQGVKLFAICFGHQMIAHALGGSVAKSNRGWGVGIHEVAITHREPWMIPSANSFRIISSHQDQVTHLPPGAVVLASTAHCPVSLFRCGTLVGVQGHPEFTVPYARALLDSRREIIPPATTQQAEDSFATPPDRPRLASWIVHYLAPNTF